uniref:Glyco_tran_28_C n=1 Tax=uncultured Thermoanaerobacter sp. TaxID=242695 RepID=A0A060CLM0_9THEO|nr:Glyco_tran_28_C [uncultured Thermoanaerobacter sp.]
MSQMMAAADLVICRAGAATIGELCALGRPSLMVPSPYVAENHQEKNARALENAGACRVLTEPDSTGEKLF